jgi:protein-S-isoprenylcysteine O-methyltransferase Ste14
MFRHRQRALPVAYLAVYIVVPPIVFWGGASFELWLDGAALLLALAGWSLRFLAVGLDYIRRGGLNKRPYADNLVTEGMFAHCRNPLYLGNLLVMLALFIVSCHLSLVLIGGILVTASYAAIIAAEERFLRDKFGEEYAAYCRATNRWIPRLRGLKATVTGARFNWRRVLLVECEGFFVWVVAVFVLDGIASDFAMNKPDLWAFATLLAAATVLLVTVQVLKRTRRLIL